MLRCWLLLRASLVMGAPRDGSIGLLRSGDTGARFRARPVASRMAATIAAVATIVEGSPTPFAPKGTSGSGSSIRTDSTGGTSTVVESHGSPPAMILYRIAVSRTVFAVGPTWSSDDANATMP